MAEHRVWELKEREWPKQIFLKRNTCFLEKQDGNSKQWCVVINLK